MAVEPDGTIRARRRLPAGLAAAARALDGDALEAAAERLRQPDVLTDYGLRTLETRSPVFGPAYYHRGSIWPFDSWIGWGGLRAAGREAEAERVRTGVLDAVRTLGRAPELYAVTVGGEVEPVPLSDRHAGLDGRRAMGAGERVGRDQPLIQLRLWVDHLAVLQLRVPRPYRK